MPMFTSAPELVELVPGQYFFKYIIGILDAREAKCRTDVATLCVSSASLSFYFLSLSLFSTSFSSFISFSFSSSLCPSLSLCIFIDVSLFPASSLSPSFFFPFRWPCLLLFIPSLYLLFSNENPVCCGTWLA